MAEITAPRIYGITDTQLLPGESLFQAVFEATQAGVAWIQYRAKTQPKAIAYEEARKLREICTNNHAKLIVNDNPQLAKAVAADGVHLGQNDMSLGEARAILGSEAIIGITCHNAIELARDAVNGGANYVAFGRFFSSSTKPDASLASLDILREARREITVPIVAIGGITPENAPQVLAAGADTLACCNSLFEANTIKWRAAQLLRIQPIL